MKKKKKFKIITIIFSFIIFIVALIGLIVYLFAFQSENRGGTLEAGKSISINCNSTYLKAFLSLEVSTSDCKEKIKYFIKNPDDKVLDQGEIEGNSYIDLEKEYFGYKGTWHIEFENIFAGEKIGYHYIFKAMNSGSKDMKR